MNAVTKFGIHVVVAAVILSPVIRAQFFGMGMGSGMGMGMGSGMMGMGSTMPSEAMPIIQSLMRQGPGAMSNLANMLMMQGKWLFLILSLR